VLTSPVSAAVAAAVLAEQRREARELAASCGCLLKVNATGTAVRRSVFLSADQRFLQWAPSKKTDTANFSAWPPCVCPCAARRICAAAFLLPPPFRRRRRLRRRPPRRRFCCVAAALASGPSPSPSPSLLFPLPAVVSLVRS